MGVAERVKSVAIRVVITMLVLTGVARAEEVALVSPAEQEVVVSGYTRNDRTQLASSEVSGKVVAVNYDVGDPIGEQPLIVIDPTFTDFKIERNRAHLRQLEVSRKKAESKMAYSHKEFRRFEKLCKTDSASVVSREAAQQEYEQAVLEVDRLREERAALENDLNELLELRRRCTITAPQGWVVTARKVEVGDIVQTGMVLAELSDYRRLVVPLSLDSDELKAVRALPALFPAVLEEMSVQARLERVNPRFDPTTRKIDVEIAIDDPPGERRGGLLFRLPLTVAADGLQVPRRAVTDRYNNPTVTLKASGDQVPVIILEQKDGVCTIATNPRLTPGQELLPSTAQGGN